MALPPFPKFPGSDGELSVKFLSAKLLDGTYTVKVVVTAGKYINNSLQLVVYEHNILWPNSFIWTTAIFLEEPIDTYEIHFDKIKIDGLSSIGEFGDFKFFALIWDPDSRDDLDETENFSLPKGEGEEVFGPPLDFSIFKVYTFYQEGINFQKLCESISASNFSFDFNARNYINYETEYIEPGYTKLVEAAVPLKVQLSDTVSIALNLSGRLNTYKYYVMTKHVRFQLEIFLNKKPLTIIYSIYYNYSDNLFNKESNRYAISISAGSYDELTILLKFLGFPFEKLDSWPDYNTPYELVKAKFKHAFYTPIENLGFVYEHAPLFVLQARGDELLWNDLRKLLEYDRSSWWNDASSAIIKLLCGFSDLKLVYDKFKTSPKLIWELYDEQEEPQKGAYIQLLIALASAYSAEDEVLNTTIYVDKNYEFHGDVVDRWRPYIAFDPVNKVPEPRRTLYTVEDGSPEPEEYPPMFHPLDLLLVKVGTEKPTPLPAIAIYYLDQKKKFEDAERTLRIGLNIISLIFGAAAIRSAIWLVRFLAYIDVAVTSINLVLEIPRVKEAIKNTPGGESFLRFWDMINLGLAVVLISYSSALILAKSINKLRNTFRQLLNNGAIDNNAYKQLDELLSRAEESAKATIARNSFEEILKAGSGGGYQILKVLSRNMFGQEKGMSCLAACIKQLAKDANVTITEAKIRTLVKAGRDGMTEIKPEIADILTDITKIKYAGGFLTTPYNLAAMETAALDLTQRGSWIAMVRGRPFAHSIIITKIENKIVHFKDPWPLEGIEGVGQLKPGVEGTMTLETFLENWVLAAYFRAL